MARATKATAPMNEDAREDHGGVDLAVPGGGGDVAGADGQGHGREHQQAEGEAQPHGRAHVGPELLDHEPGRLLDGGPGSAALGHHLRALSEQRPGDELFLILGGDQAAALGSWHAARAGARRSRPSWCSSAAAGRATRSRSRSAAWRRRARALPGDAGDRALVEPDPPARGGGAAAALPRAGRGRRCDRGRGSLRRRRREGGGERRRRQTAVATPPANGSSA